MAMTSSAASSAPASGASSSGAATSGAATSGAASSGPASSGASGSGEPSTGAAPAALTDAEIAAAKATLADSSTLTVCTSLPYQPFEVDDGSGNVIGFDMDFMDKVAKSLGVTRKVIDAKFDGIQSGQAMAAKTCDIAAAAMTINANRQKALTFSDPYYDASQGLMTTTGSGIKSLADMKGKKLGAQTGTTGLTYANANAAKNGYTVVEYEKITDEEQALASGQADAVIQDLPALNEYAKANASTVAVVTSFNTGEQYGFGMALGNTALAKIANYAIASSKADGSYAASYKKWIGTAPTS